MKMIRFSYGMSFLCLFLMWTAVPPAMVFAEQGEVEYGLAADYINDENITDHSAVIFASGFENDTWPDDFQYTRTLPQGYNQVDNPEQSYTGQGCLELQQTEGTHQPSEIHPAMPDTDVAYVRWYRKYEEGYDWTQHKMSGVYARRPGLPSGTAGIPPDGTDKFSCKLYVNWNGFPAFYSYHPDQAGPYGDNFQQNIGSPVKLATQRWYCFEMMIKANTPGVQTGENEYTQGAFDGELKMWIDGILKGHITGLRFRDAPDLFINEFTHSAYVGGTWVSQKDQKLWEDNYVVATEYIGPIPDRNPPEPVKVNMAGDSMRLAVVFSEQLDRASASNIDNYTIIPADSAQEETLVSAELADDFKTVVLTTADPLTQGRHYILSVVDIWDREPQPNRIETPRQIDVHIPRNQLLVDFGSTAEENSFGVEEWNTVIKDVYSRNQDIGPGGITICVGSNRNYDYQGVTGPERQFNNQDNIVAHWYNNSDEEITFTPRISFDDPNRIIESDPPVGQWHNMSTWYNTSVQDVVAAPHETVKTVFQFDTDLSGMHELVNVNVNYSHNRVLVCDKIELLVSAQEPVFEPDHDGDSDVDGLDLAFHAGNMSVDEISIFATRFGH